VIDRSAIRRIAIDMDEVLADALGELIARYNHEFGTTITKDSVQGHWLHEVLPPGSHIAIEGYLQQPDFFENLAVIPDSQRVLARIADRYEVFIATAAMGFPNSFGPKFRWLRKHFPFIHPQNVVFCGDKSILHADCLIDDMTRNLRAFGRAGILFSAPHNVRETAFDRVDTWQDLERIFLP
jgi:5'(3')-deoxyribonucleotidase